jgi:hypothetical protein
VAREVLLESHEVDVVPDEVFVHGLVGEVDRHSVVAGGHRAHHLDAASGPGRCSRDGEFVNHTVRSRLWVVRVEDAVGLDVALEHASAALVSPAGGSSP